MRRIPRKLWRGIHFTSYVLFWTSTFHLLLAGTDARNVFARWSVNLVIAAVVFLTLVRALGGRGRSGVSRLAGVTRAA